LWPDDCACGNLENSSGIIDSLDESIDNELGDFFTSDVSDDAAIETPNYGLEMNSEDLQVTADVKKPVDPNA